MIKMLKLGIKGNFLSLTKSIYVKSSAKLYLM